MIIKKKKAVIAAILSAAITASALMPTVSAEHKPRTKDDAFGNKTYATRFLSLYDDVVTHGVDNGYLSDPSKNPTNGGFGIPYHCVETLNVEAPDYGHETTSEAMSYIVWMAAMRDNLVNKGIKGDDGQDPGTVGDLAKAWKTMEVMVPTVQDNFMNNAEPSAQYSEEHDTPEEYPTAQRSSNTAINPIHKWFASTYKSDGGLYLLHWLADVDDWYGYGGGSGKFTFINTFQRGAEESCWETVPHACVEELKYGMVGTRGIKGVFSTDSEVAKQWSYTNAPDAEDRAIQAVYAADRWGVAGNDELSKAGKMGDQLRNNMFDKYYQKIGVGMTGTDDGSANGFANSYDAAHYLMSWYTSWGGALSSGGGNWTWQIGASHCHEFYQNPLAAYGLLADEKLNAGMKATQATEDYKKSLERQLEFYLWLQSKDGPIAGGATNSWHGRYLKYEFLTDEPHDKEYLNKYGAGAKPTTFYGMAYLEHPVYLDPGSNHWIGNQVWAVQRLAELYYVVKNDKSSVKNEVKLCGGTMTMEAALKRILDRWVEWFINNTRLTADGDYEIPSSLNWNNQPKDWTGTPDDNTPVTCDIVGYGSSDLGCVSSLANTLIWYAAAEGVKTEKAYNPYKLTNQVADPSDTTPVPEKALYLAHTLLDREWKLGRDDIGLSRTETNGSMYRLFETKVHVPNDYKGDMPGNQGTIQPGITFIDIRQKYLEDDMVKKFKAAYEEAGGASASPDAKKAAMETIDLDYHRFWHAGDIMLALGTMAELYPDLEVDKYNDNPDIEPDLKVSESIEVEVGSSKPISCNVSGSSFASGDESVATVDSTGKVTGVSAGTTTVTVTTPKGQTATVSVTVKEKSSNPTGTFGDDDYIYGDVNLDNAVTNADTIKLVKYLLAPNLYDLGKGDADSKAKALEQADVAYDGKRDTSDSILLNEYNLKNKNLEDLGPAGKK